MSAPLLELQSLSLSRGDRALCQDLSFILYPGQVLQLQGPNGAGKTSLLRVLAGLSSEYRGDIHWQFDNGLSCAESLIYLGHNSGVKAVLTARENLRWRASLRGLALEDVDIDAALAKVGLAGYEDLACNHLSAGQQRRVAVASLFLLPAQLWILDEPFTAIDRQGVAQMEAWIAEFAAAGGAVLLTTHHALAVPGALAVDLADFPARDSFGSELEAETEGDGEREVEHEQ